jgi:tRNA(fMet)-specific endonuclease VapC
MVLFELWFGIAKSTRRAVNAERLVLFLHGGLDLLPFDADDARAAGEIRVVLEARGTPIGPYDLLIAAQALRRGATLVTSNLREFERVDGLKLVDWASPSLS